MSSYPKWFTKWLDDLSRKDLYEIIWGKMEDDDKWELEMIHKEDEEETPEEYFDRKYPNASCHRCNEKLNGETVVFCGGGGGACETWYCQDCHEEGTEDCKVCCIE